MKYQIQALLKSQDVEILQEEAKVIILKQACKPGREERSRRITVISDDTFLLLLHYSLKKKYHYQDE